MHILLTDILTCPRCGPQFGLVLLADRIESRRVIAGRLGCANCRETYAVEHGAGYFGGEPRAPGDVAGEDAARSEDAIRLAALLGLERGSGYALVAGPAADHARALAALVTGVEVITVSETGAVPRAAVANINPIGIGARLPFANMRVTGVALTGAFADALLEEGARVLAALGRMVLEPAPADAVERLEAAGLRVIARDRTTIVAARV